MKQVQKYLFLIGLFFAMSASFAQDEIADKKQKEKSNIQEYTPSKLLNKGKWDIKFFNSIYTQTKRTDGGTKSISIPRETYFTNTTEIYTGVSDNSRINLGFIFQVRSNTVAGTAALDALKFKNGNNARSGLTTIAPSIRVQPFKNVGNFSFTSSFYIPVFKDTPNALYLDKRSYFWETKFFYDKTFGGGDWQIFTEVDLGFNFGEKGIDADAASENISERFANNSFSLPISVFLSYFPSTKSTIFVNAQQSFFIGYDNPNSQGQNFSQNYTSVGLGGKYQLNAILNLEASYGKFVRGKNFQGLGSTFSIGLRAIF
ncbi:MAG: hypothetical protein V3U92_08615 [Cellulophaga sp.]